MKKYFLPIATAVFPTILYAQTTIQGYLGEFNSRVLPALYGLAFTAAFLFFVYGIAKFILNSGNESAKEEGKRFILWSVVALFVISSSGLIIVFVRGEFPLLSGWETKPLPVIEIPD